MSKLSPPAVFRPWNCNPYQDAVPTSSQRFTLDRVTADREAFFAALPAPELAGWTEPSPDCETSLAEAVSTNPAINTTTPAATLRNAKGTPLRAVLKEVLFIRMLLLILS
jgi:hypothetical protein